MRALVLALLPLPAAAWEFSPGPPCALTLDMDTLAVAVTHDPGPPEWAIRVTLKGGTWPDAPAFGLEFTGPTGFGIGTDRQVLSEGGATLTVTDRGFGNVLRGFETAPAAVATAGNQSVTIPLDGAAPLVPLLEACAPATS